MATSDSNAAFADGLSSDAFPEQRSQILKRFNDLRNRSSRDMFFERPFGGEWPASRPFSHSSYDSNSSPFPSRYASKEIPIKVMHESERDNGAPEHTSNSSFSSSNGKQHEARIEPRVHHIPIKVEPRDDTNTELSRSSSASSQRSAVSAGSEASVQSLNDTASTAFGTSPKSSGSAGSLSTTKEHIIPITVESHVRPIPKKSESPLTAKPVKLKKVPPIPGQSQSTRSKNFTPTSHITRVPVNLRENCEDNAPQEPPEPKQHCLKPDPLQLIGMITEEVSSLQKQIETFSGQYQDKTYMYLDEMLTRCMLKLDNIEISGRDDVRQARKSAISFINKCITALESKVNKVKVSVASVDEPKGEDTSQAIEPEMCINNENETVSNTVETTEVQNASNKVNCEKSESEALEMVEDDSPKNENEQKEEEENMIVGESTDETQQSKEAVEKCEDEKQKSKCDESQLICNDNTYSQSKEVIEAPEDVVIQSEQISSTEMETNE